MVGNQIENLALSLPEIALDVTTRIRLWEIYNRATLKEHYVLNGIVDTHTVFIENTADQNYIIDKFLKPLGLSESDIANWYYTDKWWESLTEVQHEEIIVKTWDKKAAPGITDLVAPNSTKAIGMNFNVIKPGGLVEPHNDMNPCKINILLNDKTEAPLTWKAYDNYYYETPGLVNVMETHSITNLESITEDRIVLQLFMNKLFGEIKGIIDENRSD